MPHKVKPPLYTLWQQMRYRCESPQNSAYQWYGAKGVRVCDRWQTYANFEADMAPRPPGTTLDRIDVAKGYEPDNCRWATAKEQNYNQRRTRRITVEGKTYLAGELAKQAGVTASTILRRASLGLSLDEVISDERRKGGRSKDVEPTPMQLAGWQRGAALRKQQAQARTHCGRGHPLTPGNTVKRSNRSGRDCLVCARDKARERRDQLRAKGLPVHNYGLGADELESRRSGNFTERQKRRTHCSKGHEYTVANTYIVPDGTRVCRTCHNAKMRLRTAAKREAKQ